MPSWLALASTGVDILLLGVAVALWDAFDEGQALRAAMVRSFIGSFVVAAVLGGQLLIALGLLGLDVRGRIALTALVFTTVAISIAVTVLADPLAGLLDRIAFSRSPRLRADRAALRTTEAALPLRSASPLDDLDGDTFARLTRRALGHYGDLAAGGQPADAAARDRPPARRSAGHPTSRWNGQPSCERCSPTGSSGSSPVMTATSAPPSSGATTTLSISPMSSGCGPTPRTPPRPDSTGGPAGMAMVRHRRSAAVLPQLAERRRAPHRRGSAGAVGPRAAVSRAVAVPAVPCLTWQWPLSRVDGVRATRSRRHIMTTALRRALRTDGILSTIAGVALLAAARPWRLSPASRSA